MELALKGPFGSLKAAQTLPEISSGFEILTTSRPFMLRIKRALKNRKSAVNRTTYLCLIEHINMQTSSSSPKNILFQSAMIMMTV